jgi:hypothetical protein
MSAYLACPERGCLSAKWQPQRSHSKGRGCIHTHPSTWSKHLDERLSASFLVTYRLENLTTTRGQNKPESERSNAQVLMACVVELSSSMWWPLVSTLTHQRSPSATDADRGR